MAYYPGPRQDHARNLLHISHGKIGIIGGICGFGNHETFTRASKRRFGSTSGEALKLQVNRDGLRIGEIVKRIEENATWVSP